MKPALLVLSLSLALAGCRNANETEAPYITGVITVRDFRAFGGAAANQYPRLLVEQDPSDPSISGRGSPKSVVSWDNETQLNRSTGEIATESELQAGQRVSVWITGLVLDSYPDQVAATKIVIEKK